MSRGIGITFFLTFLSFAVSASALTVPGFRELISGGLTFLLPVGIFCLLSVPLLVLTYRSEAKGGLKGFLLLTGVSGAGVFISILLHNLIYGLFIHFFGEGIWSGAGGDEPVFFILAVVVFPLGYIIGTVGSVITIFHRSRKDRG